MKILLCSVFKPYGVDNEFGEKDNKMELFHNQVTREQGVFSMRMSHQSGGLHLIASNIRKPSVVLDFPSMEEFEKEISTNNYDVIGISFIVPNVYKAAAMVERARILSPQSRIVVGGHGAAIENVDEIVKADDICRGEGVKWFRHLLNEDLHAGIIHPVITDAVDRRILGVPAPSTGRVFMPGVGCPNKCNFCSTSHFFGGIHHTFWNSGSEMFGQLERIERPGSPTDFWVLDENFLKFEDMVRELAGLVLKHTKPWSFGLFSSAEAVKKYSMDFLARLGVRFIWMGMESTISEYQKNRDVDFPALVKDLQHHGISVLISTILFLDEHDHKSLQKDVDYTISLDPDLIQFMELGPLPGTALYRKMKETRRLRDVSYIKWHGQGEIWHRHSVFSPAESHRILVNAFRHDFMQNGPSIMRMASTYLQGYEYFSSGEKSDPVSRLRLKLSREKCLKARLLLPACIKFAPSPQVRTKALEIQSGYEAVFGKMTTANKIAGSAFIAGAMLEKQRIRKGREVLQPHTIRTEYGR